MESPQNPDTAETLSASSMTSPPGDSTFRAGEVLSGRFRIKRFIARGGMGEVYEAEDIELDECVALKILRPETKRDQRASNRFQREIHLARQVTHPNVCRIFDLFHHTSTSEELHFVTMEMLEGETLSQRIARAGLMSPSQAWPLIKQLADGLKAAHDAGVVHRDFKSGNVMLLPARDGRGTTRAVITDFGLARRHDERAQDAEITRTGEFSGTPAYMAPEQLKAGPIGPATDIYGFGIVLFEMLTGQLPFVGDTPLSTALKRLEEKPPSPRSLVPELLESWDATILRCLERDPANRFASTDELIEAFGEAPRVKRVSTPRSFLIAAAAILVVVAVLAGLFMLSRSGRVSPDSSGALPNVSNVQPRRAVAVLGFKSLTGRPEAAWMSTAFSEMLTTELSARGQLRTIAGEDVARMKADLRLQDAYTFASDTLSRIRAHLGTDIVVLGSYLVLDSRIRLDIRLQDAREGTTIATLSETGTEADLMDLVVRVGANLRGRLGLGELSGEETSVIRASFPANSTAARLYAEGLMRLRLNDAKGALKLLDEAARADDSNALIYMSIADAWTTLGYGARSTEATQKAFDLSSRLKADDRMLIEARYRFAMREYAKAVLIYRSLFTSYPDNVDYGVQLAHAQVAAGQARDAVGTLEMLQRLPAPLKDDTRIDLGLAAAFRPLGNWKLLLEASQRAVEKGRALGAPMLVARARLAESEAWSDLGDATKAMEAVEDARRLYSEEGDRWGIARSDNVIGLLVEANGQPAQARHLYEQALSTFRDIGDQTGIASELNNIAILLNNQGEWAEALKTHEQVLKLNRDIGDRRAVAVTLNNIGVIFRRRGNFVEALKRYEESLAVRREIGDRAGAARLLNNIGIVLHEQGDLGGARQRYEESVAIRRELGGKRDIGAGMSNLATALRQQGELAKSRTMHEESLKLRRQVGDKAEIAQGVIDFGDLHFDAGDLRSASAAYEEGLSISRAIGAKPIAAYALVGLGRIASTKNDMAGAADQLNEALGIRTNLGEKTTAAEAQIHLALLQIENGHGKDAEALATSAVNTFHEQKMRDFEALAAAALARALIAQRNLTSAATALARASALSATSQNPLVRLNVTSAGAQLEMESGRSGPAAQAFERVLDEATRSGFAQLVLETRLALARLALRGNDPGRGRTALSQVEADARAKGFALIAAQAAASQQ